MPRIESQRNSGRAESHRTEGTDAGPAFPTAHRPGPAVPGASGPGLGSSACSPLVAGRVGHNEPMDSGTSAPLGGRVRWPRAGGVPWRGPRFMRALDAPGNEIAPVAPGPA
jgi:hypothetical protein